VKVLPNGLAVLDEDQDRVLSAWVERDQSLNAYDPRIADLARLLPVGGVAIDGGAMLGSHTVAYAAAVGPSGQVRSFEPVPWHMKCLSHNTRHLPQVHRYQLALYSHATRLWMVPNRINAGATVVGNADDPEAIEVVAVPLDSFDFPRCDLLKLDLEGLVLRGLQGANELLARCRPKVVCEVGDNLRLFGDTTADVIQFMTDRGYLAQDLPQMDGQGDPETQRDIVFTPKEAI
jgi:FkbM family methyltransferase